jgi:hypothetical protein
VGAETFELEGDDWRSRLRSWILDGVEKLIADASS